jgi:hypothetical protein
MTKVAVFVKKRVISLANVPKKAKIVPRGVVSSAERRAIAKPIVPMKLRMAAVIKGAVLSARVTTWLRNANYPTPVESAKKKVTWQPTANSQTNVISVAKKVIWPPIAKSQTNVASVVKKAIKPVIVLVPRPMKSPRRTGLNMKSIFRRS